MFIMAGEATPKSLQIYFFNLEKIKIFGVFFKKNFQQCKIHQIEAI